ncbi:MAG TPA: SPOR domain-containing protein [Candidatus Acidoferrales bacterium]|nr:SPOR domain-containing protein [Candidatus Acidoferrales bacterium]
MAGRSQRGRDWVLGGGQLAGIFILLVVLFGVVFTLGYLLGRNQYDAQLKADASSIPGKPEGMAARANEKPFKPGRGGAGSLGAKSDSPAAANTDWSFYHSAEPETPSQPLSETPKSLVPARSAGSGTGKASSHLDSGRLNMKSVSPPVIPSGAAVLQIAAMARQADAVSLAQALQQKKFPAFVLPPGADRYYRVQVGPYSDAKSADLAKHKLESQGFKAIIRR